MSGNVDKIKGRVKQGVGGATGDRSMQHEGRLDEFSGDVKSTSEDIADKAGDAADRTADKVEDVVDEARDRGSRDSRS